VLMHFVATTLLFETRDGLPSHVRAASNRECYAIAITRWMAEKTGSMLVGHRSLVRGSVALTFGDFVDVT
jgi:hypothetical protein